MIRSEALPVAEPNLTPTRSRRGRGEVRDRSSGRSRAPRQAERGHGPRPPPAQPRRTQSRSAGHTADRRRRSAWRPAQSRSRVRREEREREERQRRQLADPNGSTSDREQPELVERRDEREPRPGDPQVVVQRAAAPRKSAKNSRSGRPSCPVPRPAAGKANESVVKTLLLGDDRALGPRQTEIASTHGMISATRATQRASRRGEEPEAEPSPPRAWRSSPGRPKSTGRGALRRARRGPTPAPRDAEGSASVDERDTRRDRRPGDERDEDRTSQERRPRQTKRPTDPRARPAGVAVRWLSTAAARPTRTERLNAFQKPSSPAARRARRRCRGRGAPRPSA